MSNQIKQYIEIANSSNEEVINESIKFFEDTKEKVGSLHLTDELCLIILQNRTKTLSDALKCFMAIWNRNLSKFWSEYTAEYYKDETIKIIRFKGFRFFSPILLKEIAEVVYPLGLYIDFDVILDSSIIIKGILYNGN